MSRARGSISPPPSASPPAMPEGEGVVRAFAAAARTFCAMVGSPPPDAPRERARRLVAVATELYAAALPLLALELPDELAADQPPEDTIDVPIAIDWADLGAGPAYHVVVEPFSEAEPALASLQDDLEEILAELAAGLALLDEGPERWPAAALEWRMAFVGGWGRHLTSLLYVAHCALGE